jgi:uncharacterized Zn-finger protein
MRHEKSIHSNIKPFACLKCEKTFKRSDALKRHTGKVGSKCFLKNNEAIKVDGGIVDES